MEDEKKKNTIPPVIPFVVDADSDVYLIYQSNYWSHSFVSMALWLYGPTSYLNITLKLSFYYTDFAF